MASHKLLLLPGDGIGTEVMAEVKRVIAWLNKNGTATFETLRWANDNAAAIREADPEVPDELHDRAADNWRPLLAIADQEGGDWPKRARHAAVQLTLAGADKDTVEVCCWATSGASSEVVQSRSRQRTSVPPWRISRIARGRSGSTASP